MHNNYLKVSGNDSLVRDMNTFAIINTNNSEYDNYIKQRDKIYNQESQMQQHSLEINNIKQDLSDIKNLLMSLVNKGS
ncbi:hypothetical protein UFOVP84_23 [uncultured Caudovirales phage]|uniref:Uncharacterized protein n=1 Tax=uncultured Caudovirales phage TaxID=2100421 RepID=A0A6J5KZU8_9CAUD|nr:hypothetical protein UFOVP84_23 [uncultured Caudovirales phage]